MSGKYPNTIYRGAVKALIRDSKGHVLVVKEHDDTFWSLPGGGIDHGETTHEALVRELNEEALITAPFEEQLIAAESVWVESHQTWILWLVFEVKLSEATYGAGEDTVDITYIDPALLKDSDRRESRLVWELSQRY